MASNINFNTIDSAFPVAGQDNSSQGFRDNFQNIKTNFEHAYTEITDLQNNAVQKGQTNDMEGSILSNAAMLMMREVSYDLGVQTGPMTYDFELGNYQTVELGGSVSVSFTNFSGIENAITVRLEAYVPSTSYTITWPSSVSKNLSSLDNQSGTVSRFSATGYYLFQLTTTDGGTNWTINELTRNRNSFQGNVNFTTVVNSANNTVESGVTITVANIGGTAIGNIYADNVFGNFVTSGTSATFTGDVTANRFYANVGYYGNIKTPLQPEITLVGTLSSLSVTGAANVGNLTVSGMTDMCAGTMYGVQYVAATTGTSTQIFSNVGICILDPAGTIASHSLTMPATPQNGQIIKIGFGNTITALTHTASGGHTLLAGLTTANTSSGGEWAFYNNVWYRVS